MQPKVIQRDEDGTVLGIWEESLYRGVPKQVAFDELTEEVKVAKDGSSVEKTVKYEDQIIGQSSLTKDAVIEQYFTLYHQGTTSKEDAHKMAELEWEKNLTPQSRQKAYINALVDGKLEPVEQKITVYDWEKL